MATGRKAINGTPMHPSINGCITWGGRPVSWGKNGSRSVDLRLTDWGRGRLSKKGKGDLTKKGGYRGQQIDEDELISFVLEGTRFCHLFRGKRR